MSSRRGSDKPELGPGIDDIDIFVALIGIDIVACLWAGIGQVLATLQLLSLPALPRSVNSQSKVVLGVCSLPSTWERHGLPTMAPGQQYDQYKETPTSAMLTLDALKSVEQCNSTPLLAHAAAAQAACES